MFPFQRIDARAHEFNIRIKTPEKVAQFTAGANVHRVQRARIDQRLDFGISFAQGTNFTAQQEIEQWHEQKNRQRDGGQERNLRAVQANHRLEITQAYVSGKIPVHQQRRIELHDLSRCIDAQRALAQPLARRGTGLDTGNDHTRRGDLCLRLPATVCYRRIRELSIIGALVDQVQRAAPRHLAGYLGIGRFSE